jgi:hypothetical protein
MTATYHPQAAAADARTGLVDMCRSRCCTQEGRNTRWPSCLSYGEGPGLSSTCAALDAQNIGISPGGSFFYQSATLCIVALPSAWCWIVQPSFVRLSRAWLCLCSERGWT